MQILFTSVHLVQRAWLISSGIRCPCPGLSTVVTARLSPAEGAQLPGTHTFECLWLPRPQYRCTKSLGVTCVAHCPWDMGSTQCPFRGLPAGTVVTQSMEGPLSRCDLVGHQLHLPRHLVLMPSAPGLLRPSLQGPTSLLLRPGPLRCWPLCSCMPLSLFLPLLTFFPRGSWVAVNVTESTPAQ